MSSRSLAARLGLSRADAARLTALRSPERIQTFIDRLPTNFEPNGDTCHSVVQTLRHGRAHCIEAAMLAACALWLNGQRPLLMDMQAIDDDDDHVVALFKRGDHWGAISKSNHVWLRWRDPVYRNLRELALSYFHEYVKGSRKTLRRYSMPYDLRRMDPKHWVTNEGPCWEVAGAIDEIRHYPLISPAQARLLRLRDDTEVRAGQLVQYARPAPPGGKRKA